MQVPSNEVQIRLWRKLAVNAAINAVTALVDCPNGQLLDSPSGKRIASAVVNEVALLASATLGQHPLLLADDIAAHVFKVAHTTRRNLSSMCIDIRLGRASEIEYINGYVASAAKQMGLPTPVNDALAELVRMKEESMVKGGEC
jgi:2-dehydropantoate 2-reductase